jgi:hypothetical protein
MLCAFLAVPMIPSNAATTMAATLRGEIPFRTVPALIPRARADSKPSRQAEYTFSNRRWNPSSSGDISCARLLSGHPWSNRPFAPSSLANCRIAFFTVAIGSMESARGSSQRFLMFVNYCVSKIVLIFEMMKKRALRRAGLVHDPINAAPLETVFVKFIKSSFEDFSPCAFRFSIHGCLYAHKHTDQSVCVNVQI